MAAVGKFLRSVAGGGMMFWCPGCNGPHAVSVDSPVAAANWGYNRNPDAPTFTPSVLVRGGHFAEGREHGDCWCTYEARMGKPAPFSCKLCHSFVTDGRIQFLSDSSHAMAGQTVELAEWPAHFGGA